MTLTLGSLFSGFGGLDLAVQAVLGARTVWHCENDRAASIVLAQHWPGVPNLGDITKVDWTTVPPVDILAGGSPCQGLSMAGRRAGMADPRSGLWTYMAAGIAALRPSLVIWENVRGALSTPAGQPITDDSADDEGDDDGSAAVRGVDGDGLDDGPGGPVRAFGVVLAELAELGYDATWCGLPASAVGSPHSRFRIFLVATPADSASAALRDQKSDHLGAAIGRTAEPGERLGAPAANADVPGRQWQGGPGARVPREDPARVATAGRVPVCSPAPDADDAQSPRQPSAQRRNVTAAGSGGDGDGIDWREWGPAVRRWEYLTRPAPSPVEPGPRGGRPRLAPAFPEWMMGLPAGWITRYVDHPDPALRISRNDALRLAGNGVVPQQAATALPWLIQQHFGVEVAA